METAGEYLNWIKKNKFLKTVSSHRDSFSLTDVAMKAGGADTAVYLKQPELQVRMRRGLTFLEMSDSIEIVRQGLPKFFDLELKELRFLPHQYPITFHNLEKLNGENAQISYSNTINKWIICSKNVSIAAENLEEAETFYSSETRFNFPLYIARHWFNGCLKNAINIEELRETLCSSTLIGEVCDISENQHIVDNPTKMGLIFFAIVTKTPSGPRTELCTLPDKAMPVFKRFNLPHVDVGKSCVLESPEDFSKLETFIQDLTVDASPDPYVCLSEGSVVYATERSGKVLFLAKVKTTKYRILRRVRELMKNAVSHNEASKVRSRFRQDLKKWGFTDPLAVSDYMQLIEACNYVRVSQKWSLDKISRWFINFLHEAIKALKAGSIPIVAPTISSQEASEVEENASISKGKQPRLGRGRKNVRSPKHEAESSEDEDKEFSNLPGDVNV
jgi:hypothetical protein